MTCMVRFFRHSVCLALAILLTGCAFGTRQATLVYPPAGKSLAKVGAPAEAKPEARETKVLLVQFRDERSDKSVVGTVRNGFGMRTADVVSTNDISDWVTKSLRSELQARGLSVVSEAPPASADARSVTVSGEILNVFCDMYMSYTGQVSLVVRVSGKDGEIFNKHYAGEGSAGLAVAATGESYAQSLALALSVALKKFVADLETGLAGR